MPGVFCTHEDRPASLVGVALLISSVRASGHTEPFVVFTPHVPDWFETFARQQSGVELRDRSTLTASGWSVKPDVLLQLLAERREPVTWLDADILVRSSIAHLLASETGSHMTIAEEPQWAGLAPPCERARSWGLTDGRRFTPPLNSCVLSINNEHAPLMQRWRELMSTTVYQSEQRLPFHQRQSHLASDQDVLEALLSSSDFRHIPLRILRTGHDIAQCHLPDGYHTAARVRHVWGNLPPIIHAQGLKPWEGNGQRRRVYQDLSPYLIACRTYLGKLPAAEAALKPQRKWAEVVLLLLAQEPNLPGLPFAAVTEIQRRLRVRSRLSGWRQWARRSSKT